jgi:hypothetical protein
MPQLKLFEELLLIKAYAETYRDGKPTGNGIGVQPPSSVADDILAKAVLAELAVGGRIRVARSEATERQPAYKHAVAVTDSTPLGDVETDAALEEITMKPDPWVGWVLGMMINTKWSMMSPQWPPNSTRRRRLLDRLADAGQLRVYPHRVWGIFPARTYPIVDQSVPTDAKARLDSVLEGAEADARTAALALLVIGPDPAWPLVAYGGVPEQQLKELRGRLRAGEWADHATCWTIQVLTGMPHGGRHNAWSL